MQARDGFTGVEIAHRIGRNLKRVNEIIHRVKNSVQFFSRKETVLCTVVNPVFPDSAVSFCRGLTEVTRLDRVAEGFW
jgi:uncharacterized membrane protein YdjX (TVP38/TMEM64 family)